MNLKEFCTTVTHIKTPNILICSVSGIKVDFVNYGYPLVGDVRLTADIRLASLKDIPAMKLNAIARRGSKKDFIDILFAKHFYNRTNDSILLAKVPRRL